MTRRPCATCPWRVSTKRGDYPGGGIDADGLIEMLDEQREIMQCHNTPDGPLARSCVGFVLQVGNQHNGACMHRVRSALRGETFDTDEPLHDLKQLIRHHGVRVCP